jgi:hypothetical protein
LAWGGYQEQSQTAIGRPFIYRLDFVLSHKLMARPASSAFSYMYVSALAVSGRVLLRVTAVVGAVDHPATVWGKGREHDAITKGSSPRELLWSYCVLL